MINLKDHKVLITGGSRGIGRAAALLFADAGADVAITYQCRDEAALAVQAAVAAKGRACAIHTLVNNAGIWNYLEIGGGDAAAWKTMMEVNLDSLFYLANAVVPHMKKQGRGRIVNVGSTAGIRGEAYHSHYAATKGAMNALTKSWAVEFAPWNINVNCVAPGWVDTDMCTEVFKDPVYRESVRQSIPLKRIPPPEDIAGPILFLASELARHITGAVLSVNGGGVLCGA